jgi:hypothetical protein
MLHSANYSSYALPLTGGTLSGPLTINTTGDIVANSETFRMKGGGGSGEFIWYRNYSGSPSHPGFVIINRSGTTTFSHNSNGGGTSVSGNFSAANFSGSSSGTNTGDQTNISGLAGSETLATVTGRGASTSTAIIMSGGSGTTSTLMLDRNIASPSNYYSGLQFEVRATSGTAGIALHRSGFSHVGIYHDTVNVLKFELNSGTVTLNHNTGTVWGTGNLTNLNQLSNGPGYITGESDTLASVTGRGASTNTAISVNNNITITGGRLIVRTGGVNTYGVFSGYDNNNHMMTFRASVTGSTDSPTFTAIHQTTFVEYAESNDTTGWYFKSASTGTYQEIARITRAGINYNGNVVLHAGNYSSYALPLSGGTLSGILYFTDTTNGIYKSGGRMTVRSESTDNVANFAEYGLYLPRTGREAGLYVESPIEARGGIRLGGNAGNGTITVGADTGAGANRLVQRDGSGDTYVRYSFATYFNQSAGNSENPTIGQIWTQNTSDNYVRKSSPAHFISQLGLITSSNIGSQSVNFATSATSASSTGTVTGRYRGAFTVGGNVNTFYPVAFQIGSGSTTEQGISVIQIERGGYDEPGYSNYTFSTFHCRIRAKADGWGFGASYVQVEANAYTQPMLANVTQQNQTSQLIVWLRGGCAYRWLDIEGGWSINFANTNGTSYTTFNGNSVYDPTTTNTIGGNFKYQQGWGNNYISGTLSSSALSVAGLTSTSTLTVGSGGDALAIAGAQGRITFRDQDVVWTGYVGFRGNLGILEFPGRNVQISCGYNGNVEINTGTNDFLSGRLTVPFGSVNARRGFTSESNPWGTADSSFHPNGITTGGGTNWVYGTTYIGNAPSNGSGAEVRANGSSYFRSSNTSGAWGFAGQFVDRSNAANNYTPWSFENEYGNHSWGIVARFHIQQSGADKSGIQFTTAGSNERWSIGYCTASDFNFRITQNLGFRTDGSGNSDGWGTERFRINTDGSNELGLGSTRVNFARHIDARDAWGSCSCTTAFLGWHGGKVVLGNGNSGGHDYANGLGTNTVVSTNPFFCYQDITAYSDSRVKENVEVIEDAVEKVKAIRGVTFTRNDVEDLNKRHAGVIAQEILEVLPEAVSEDSRGHLSVAYGNLTSLLIEAIKEQQLQIDDLKNKLDLLTQNK